MSQKAIRHRAPHARLIQFGSSSSKSAREHLLRGPVDEQISLDIAIERWPLKKAFRITGYTFVEFGVLVVILRQNGWAGRGEAAGVYYRNDTPGRMAKQVEAVRATVESGR